MCQCGVKSKHCKCTKCTVISVNIGLCTSEWCTQDTVQCTERIVNIAQCTLNIIQCNINTISYTGKVCTVEMEADSRKALFFFEFGSKVLFIGIIVTLFDTILVLGFQPLQV